ncbi:two-component sensor histidine kinase [Microbacterium nanhaiense]|uniref:histidine kinase n=2 Tax=Microbacterium nanhaiense TaxID=1301026 RepID=A0ABQ2N5H6_9MICO|nr:two-component sensor histidine kinase [Microbacterium nanhaiense]
MRESNPSVGFSLLWVFPAIWLATSFGLFGLLLANLFITGIYWFALGTDSQNGISPTAVLIPMIIGAVTVTSYVGARRSAFQRLLLDLQARQLISTAAQAHQQENTLKEVLDSVDFGVVRISSGGKETVHNDAHTHMQGLLGSGERHPALYAADGITELTAEQTPLARARRGETFERDLVWYGRPGEGRRALSVISRALPPSATGPAGGILVSLDVTDEVTALRAREDLVASVSHELRTPLTSILGYLELALESDDLSEGVRRKIEIAERNATRLLTIVSDILTASAQGNGGVQVSIRAEGARLDTVVRAAVEGFRTAAAARQMTIDSTAVEEVTAFIDPVRIRQVADNLLGNAVKYGKDGGTIDVGVTCDDDHAWLVVRDDGPGISEEELPRLFDRFFRADSVRRTSVHGSGLGLSITREIVRGHGGNITVQSPPGSGATFVVRLPLHQKETIDHDGA